MSGEEEKTDQETFPGPEYVNTQQVTRGVAVADVAAYVERKRREDGFKGEFKVKSYILLFCCKLLLAICSNLVHTFHIS